MHKTSTKKPLGPGKVARVPIIIQMEMLECGAACLDMILAYYGRWVPLEKMRVDCGVSRNGSNLKNMLSAAEAYGLEVGCYRTEPEALEENGTFPCIIHWNFNHFVVVDGFTKNSVIINDPASGRKKVSRAEFDENFTGVCVLLEPGENFVPGGKRKSVVKFAKSRLTDAMAAVLFVALTAVLSQLINFISPAFSRILLDYLMPGKDPEWVVPFLIIFAAFSLLQIILSGINCLNMYRIEGQMEIVGSSSFMWKLFRLPIEFFSQRMAGDIQMRLSSNAGITTSLVHTVGPLLLDMIMMIFYLVVMVRYSLVLAVIGVCSVLAHFVINYYTMRISVNINRSVTQKAGKLSGIETAAFSMIESIQASGAENGYFDKWAGHHAALNAEQYKRHSTVRYLNMLPSIVSSLSGILILGIAMGMAINGHFTLGMIMAFQSLLASFTAPAQSLIFSSGTIQEMRTEMERVEDVMCYEDDPDFVNEQYDASLPYEKLRGEVELSRVTFGYSRLAEPLITDFNMHVKPGSRIAFVGPSGCGKSTLTKLITGLHQPWSGEILLDGKKRTELSRSVTTGSVAVVTQEVYLYEDTIENNIRMFDASISEQAVLRAARDAQIHDEILTKEGGYQHVLLENGNDLSGGQKQRLEIARALAQEPSVIVLDEATSALDAKTEYDVIKAITARGITCIIVAHRLSTIRDCDEILVMDRGRVIERGTHKELMENKGFYEKLIRSE